MAANNFTSLPNLSDLQSYNVNRVGQYEGIRASLYDFQTYAQAGQTELNFFQTPVGQASKTLADTNMQGAGALPNPINFLVTDIQVYFQPADTIAHFGTEQVANLPNDVYAVSKSGWLEFFVGSKNYVQEGPIGRFPPRNGISGFAAAADASTAGAALQTQIAYATFGGRAWEMKPPILLTPTQNFRVSLKWNSAQSISAAGRIGIVMEGILYRLSQ